MELITVSKYDNIDHGFVLVYFNAKARSQIEDWPVALLAEYARLVELLIEFGPDLRRPYSRALGKGLFELRPCAKGISGRALYCYATGRCVIVLHSFIKKTRATPAHDLLLARRRMKEVRDD